MHLLQLYSYAVVSAEHNSSREQILKQPEMGEGEDTPAVREEGGLGKPQRAPAICPVTAPSGTSESATGPEAQTPSTPFSSLLFQTVLLPLIFLPEASFCTDL